MDLLFTYRPLDPEKPSFRLLRLLRARQTEIECELFHASLDDRSVSYEALSYCAGNSDSVEGIKINGKYLWINKSLHSALLHLRLRDIDRVLWVDTLCVQQALKQEKNHQIRQIGRIFSQAHQVVFWLGKPSYEIKCLMDLLCRFITDAELFSIDSDHWDAPIKNHDTLASVWKKTLASSTLGKRGPRTLRAALTTLFKRPWFKRIWTVQEVAKARSGLVCTGISAIPAKVFALSPKLLRMDPRKIPEHVRSIIEVMPGQRDKEDSWWSQGRDLSILVHKFAAARAPDERDKIFALLDIASDTKPEDLHVDYFKSIMETYRNALYFIMHRRNVSQEAVFALLKDLKLEAIQMIGLPNTPNRIDVLELPPDCTPLQFRSEKKHQGSRWMRCARSRRNNARNSDIPRSSCMILLHRSRKNEMLRLLTFTKVFATRCDGGTPDSGRWQTSHFRHPKLSLKQAVQCYQSGAFFQEISSAMFEFVRLMHDAGVALKDPRVALPLIALDGREEVIKSILHRSGLLDDPKALAHRLDDFMRGLCKMDRSIFEILLKHTVGSPTQIDDKAVRRSIFKSAVLSEWGDYALPILLKNGKIRDLGDAVRFLCSEWYYSYGYFRSVSLHRELEIRKKKILQLHEYGAQDCLIEAVRMGWADVVQSLLESSTAADANRYDPRTGNALWWALGKGRMVLGREQDAEIVGLLRKHGANEAIGPRFPLDHIRLFSSATVRAAKQWWNLMSLDTKDVGSQVLAARVNMSTLPLQQLELFNPS